MALTILLVESGKLPEMPQGRRAFSMEDNKKSVLQNSHGLSPVIL
ncbi:hypothetical protein [Candidatus Methylacidiphilum infernorum]|nr:hypothetical protein [Candidatus Methylacidiphilum infernorum]